MFLKKLSPRKTVLLAGLFFLVSLIGGAFISYASFRMPQKDKGLPLASFELLNRFGENVGLEDLKGKVWVANFIFTSCPGVCPLLSRQMQKIQARFGKREDFLSVSFTVDPETDKPEVLKTYANKYKAAPESWWFLSGPRGELKKVLQEGFRVVMGSMKDAESGLITHSNKFVVVDRSGVIRAYYDMSSEDENFDSLEKKVEKYLGQSF